MNRRSDRWWVPVVGTLGSLALCAYVCACAPAGGDPNLESPTVRTGAPTRAHVEVVSTRNPVPAGGDGAPRSTLALVRRDGSRLLLDQEAVAFAPFRDGVALVNPDGQLWLVAGDGAKRVLAERSAGTPVRAPTGELIYGERHGEAVAVHSLGARGGDRVLARLVGSVGLFAPLSDGRLIFVGTQHGGIAGLWYAASKGGARCLTNCEVTGVAGSQAVRAGRALPVPGRAADIAVRGDRLQWLGFDGQTYDIPWPPPEPGADAPTSSASEAPELPGPAAQDAVER